MSYTLQDRILRLYFFGGLLYLVGLLFSKTLRPPPQNQMQMVLYEGQDLFFPWIHIGYYLIFVTVTSLLGWSLSLLMQRERLMASFSISAICGSSLLILGLLIAKIAS